MGPFDKFAESREPRNHSMLSRTWGLYSTTKRYHPLWAPRIIMLHGTFHIKIDVVA